MVAAARPLPDPVGTVARTVLRRKAFESVRRMTCWCGVCVDMLRALACCVRVQSVSQPDPFRPLSIITLLDFLTQSIQEPLVHFLAPRSIPHATVQPK